MLEKNYFLSFLAFCTMYRYGILEKGTLHFHDFVHISKTYPLQSLKKKEVFKDGKIVFTQCAENDL